MDNFSLSPAVAGKFFIPGGFEPGEVLPRITDICFAAHHDDVEIMCYGPISDCFKNDMRRFAAVILSDGGGSPRSGAYAGYTDDDMKAVRVKEQKTAAIMGEYEALGLLNYKSADIKTPGNKMLVSEITDIIKSAKPDTVYTHNLADKHDTHVCTALRVIEALRSIPENERPKKVYGLEVWRGLDWMCDEDKALFDTSKNPNMASALVGIFDSQVSGGKRYDLAALGRRVANATFFASHAVDDCDSMTYGVDMTDFVYSEQPPEEFMQKYIDSFAAEVKNRIAMYVNKK